MADNFRLEPMLDMYLFETTQLVEQLEQSILVSEKSACFSGSQVNEIFRIMHTIKGSSAMMLFDSIAIFAHAMEDVFYYIRESKPENIDCSTLSDLIFAGIDFIKAELQVIQTGGKPETDAHELLAAIKEYLVKLKGSEAIAGAAVPQAEEADKPQQYYISQDKNIASAKKNYFKATVFFQPGCEMENMRAYTLIHDIEDIGAEISYQPEDIIENDQTVEIIRQQGFEVSFSTQLPYKDVHNFLSKTILLDKLILATIDADKAEKKSNTVMAKPGAANKKPETEKQAAEEELPQPVHQSIISVSVTKLDRLMDLIGELVISEAMVTQHPELRGLNLDNFHKSARHLEKITSELQDMIMSIRMVPLAPTFHKMHRVVRDMSKKLDKEITLELIGEETEVDKNIIENISDPLMHLIRNAIDHGIEATEDRVAAGKPAAGKVMLEAKAAGSEVIILIKDDGRGLNKEKILARARANNLIHKPEQELTEREIYSFIFLPGFSTSDQVSEFSGRGVGMDVVTRNINSVGGVVQIESQAGVGTTIAIKIPLTLAIIDGMTIGVGEARYTLPITSIRQSFKPLGKDIITDPEGNEMIMVRGNCYPILRIHRLFQVPNATVNLCEGIMVMVESEERTFCLFADQLIGEQQVVVKALPAYIRNIRRVQGIAGCTLLGDGSISLILDIGGLISGRYFSG